METWAGKLMAVAMAVIMGMAVYSCGDDEPTSGVDPTNPEDTHGQTGGRTPQEIVLEGDSAPDFVKLIDLALPSGTLWASDNVGAFPETTSTTLMSTGFHYQWAMTSAAPAIQMGGHMDSNGYKWGTGFFYTTFDNNQYHPSIYKYNTEPEYATPEHPADGLTRILPEDDVASVKWGASWRIPTLEEMEELLNSDFTNVESFTTTDAEGLKVTSRINGKSIYIPFIESRPSTRNNQPYYWTSDLSPSNATGSYLDSYVGSYVCFASALYYDSDNKEYSFTNKERDYAAYIRPVFLYKNLDLIKLGLYDSLVD